MDQWDNDGAVGGDVYDCTMVESQGNKSSLWLWLYAATQMV